MLYNRMMKLQKPTLDWVNQVSSSGKNRTDSYALALGYVVARSLALPAQNVECIQTYHRHMNTVHVLEQIDQVNEITPLQVKAAKAYVDSFYFLRYKAVHPDLVPLAFNKESAIVDFFGISKHFSKETLELIQADSENIAHLINGLTTMLSDLTKQVVREEEAQPTEEPSNYVAE